MNIIILSLIAIRIRIVYIIYSTNIYIEQERIMCNKTGEVTPFVLLLILRAPDTEL